MSAVETNPEGNSASPRCSSDCAVGEPGHCGHEHERRSTAKVLLSGVPSSCSCLREPCAHKGGGEAAPVLLHVIHPGEPAHRQIPLFCHRLQWGQDFTAVFWIHPFPSYRLSPGEGAVGPGDIPTLRSPPTALFLPPDHHRQSPKFLIHGMQVCCNCKACLSPGQKLVQ